VTPLVPIAGSVVLNAAAQISLRRASWHRGGVAPSHRHLWLSLWALCFVVATILWLTAIRHADISYAYPLLGAGYVLVTLLARLLLNEPISIPRWISVLIITLGVVLVGVSP